MGSTCNNFGPSGRIQACHRLSATRYPTISCLFSVAKNVTPLDNAPLSLHPFANKIQRKLLEYWNRNSMDILVAHKLDPCFKSAFIEDTQIPVLKQLSGRFNYNASQPSSAVDQAVGSYCTDALLPRPESPLCDEINRYFEMPRCPYITNPLEWWKDMRPTYPTIPATSLFSTASNIYDKKRGNLSKEAVRSILFLHENWKTMGLDDVVLPAPGIHPTSISNSEVDNPPPEDDTV